MRKATIYRQTRETDVRLELNLDGEGRYELITGIPFLNHLLSHVAVHSLFDLSIEAKGDREVDDHHTVEDIGICLGSALKEALADKRGIVRYAHCLLPMDEALVMMAVDISGRGLLEFDAPFPQPALGQFNTELVREFLRAVAMHGGVTLHVKLLSGVNTHHIAEAIFKALGRCLGEATRIDPRRSDIVPSTKGTLES